jgi:putative ABC transport system permease protein
MIRDLRHAFRSLSRSPGFTLATVLTLALGIGANSAIFSVVDAVLLKPLPFERAAELVEVYARTPWGSRDFVSQPDFDDWRAMTRSFSGLASWVPQSVTLTGLSEPERLMGVFVSANFFPLLDVSPAIGRGLLPGEDRAGGERVAVLSDRVWHTRFGGDAGTIGKSIQLNGEPFRVVGILPPAFVFPLGDGDVYLPAFKYPNYKLERAQTSAAVIGRLRSGVTIAAAQAEMDTVTARLGVAYPASNQGRSGMVVSMKESMVQRLRPSVLALATAVAFVLLIGCANVASLLVARMVGRERERAVRVALGASRSHLMSYVMAEALVLAAAGGGLGLLIAVWTVPPMGSAIAVYFPDGITVQLDHWVVLFTLGVSFATALLVAAVPAWHTSAGGHFREGRGAGRGAGRNRARGVLVAGEVALTVVLLVGAGLMIKSLNELGRSDPGFDTHHVMMLAYRVPRGRYPTGAQQVQFHNQVVEKIRAVPGVLAAASVRAVPFGDNGNTSDFLLTDRPEPPVAEHPTALINMADPNFFGTLRIPVLRGRVFEDRDQLDAPPVIVVNETLARRYFPDRDPIGQHLRIPSMNKIVEIVGVVGDVKQFTRMDPPAPQIYGALAQNPFLFTSLAVRTSGDPMKLANDIRRAIWQVDKDQPVWTVRSIDEVLATQSSRRELVTRMLAGYAALAVLLAAIGIFGLISYAVGRRTAEIGVRIALGASRSDVVRLVVRQGLTMVGAGIAIGAGVAAWLSRYLASQLYEVSPLDPVVYAEVAGLLVLIATAACLIPAGRAIRVNPVRRYATSNYFFALIRRQASRMWAASESSSMELSSIPIHPFTPTYGG